MITVERDEARAKELLREMREKYGESYWKRMDKQGGERRPDYQERVFDQAEFEFKAMEALGYLVAHRQYVVRVNDRLDIYPRNQRWHDVKKNKRGQFIQGRMVEFVEKFFAKVEQEEENLTEAQSDGSN